MTAPSDNVGHVCTAAQESADQALHLLQLHEEERRHVCFDIHDGIAQPLVPALHYIQVLESLPASRQNEAPALLLKTRRAIQQALTEARAIIEGLRLDELGNRSLHDVLSVLLNHCQSEYDWQVAFEVDDLDLVRDDQEILFRIIKEGLTNIQKHANSRRVTLTVRALPNHGFEVILQDWGSGFDLDNPGGLHRNSGLGLYVMRRRAEQLNARFEITSEKGQGTRVRIVSNQSSS